MVSNIITGEDLVPLEERIQKLEDQVSAPAVLSTASYYNNQTLSKEFGVSKRTIKGWVDKGLLGYCKVGRVIIYRAEDVQLFLRKHLNEPFIVKRVKNHLNRKL